MDYQTGEVTPFEVETKEELFRYIENKIKRIKRITVNQNGCILEKEVQNACFYNIFFFYDQAKIYNSFYQWDTNVRQYPSEWERLWNNTLTGKLDSYLLPGECDGYKLIDGYDIEDVKISLLEFSLTEIPSVRLFEYIFDQLDNYSPQPNAEGYTRFRNIYEKDMENSETLDLIPEEPLFMIPNPGVTTNGLFDIISYEGQYSMNPWKLFAVTKIKYRVEGALPENIPISSVSIIENKTRQSPIYDLHGRQIVNPQPGSICIRNGKKFLAK